MAERQTLAIDGVFDIETEGWSTFVLGEALTADGEAFQTTDPHALLDFMLAHGGQWWAANGGLFDTIWALQIAREMELPVTAVPVGPRVVTATIGRGVGRLVLRDATALIPIPLRDMAAFGTVGQKGEFDYSLIKRGMDWRLMAKLGEYLHQDCLVLLSALQGFFAVAEELGLVLRPTVGATAWKTAAKFLGLSEEPLSPAEYYGARAGYYGGRVQVFRPRADRVHCYDLNSAYPHALATLAVPVGERFFCAGERARAAYRNDLAGIYTARVRVPDDMHIPPLPVRTSQRIGYPVGTFDGTWPAIELQYAESLGVEIVDVHSAWCWTDTEVVFGDFMRHLFEARKRYGRKSPQGIALKFVANSFTGKLAQDPESETLRMGPGIAELAKVCPGGDCGGVGRECRNPRVTRSGRRAMCCRHRCTRRCGRWDRLAPDIWSVPGWRIPGNARPELAAYLTGGTRVELHSMLIADGKSGQTAAYCDTDSCYATARRSRNLGDDLGQWGYDGTMMDFVAFAPKAYAGIHGEDGPGHKKGQPVQRLKGLPKLTRQRFLSYAAGRPTAIETGVMPLKSAARSGGELFTRRQTHRAGREPDGWYGDRILRGDLTRPVDLPTLTDHERNRATKT